MEMKNINWTCLRPWPLLLASEKGVEGNVGDLHNLEPETGTEKRIRNASYHLPKQCRGLSDWKLKIIAICNDMFGNRNEYLPICAEQISQ